MSATCAVSPVAWGYVFSVGAVAVLGSVLATGPAQSRAPFPRYPRWVWVAIWVCFYVFVALAGYLADVAAAPEIRADIRSVFFAQLLFYVAWLWAFFRLGNMGAAFVLGFLLAVANGTLLVLFARISAPATALFFPYVLWTAFISFWPIYVWFRG